MTPLDETATNLTGPARLATNQVLAGRYRILEMLGMGAMGMVYRARDEELDVEVALKVLRPELGSDEGLLARFRRELVLARQVTHKHVVRIHDLGKDGDLVFLTMDLVPGRSLREVLEERGALPADEAAAFAAQLAGALEAAHQRGVVHRDLKPSNVMVDADGNAYITDFGVAHSSSLGGLTRTGMVVGTPDYLSPEQVRGEELDGRADIYALGVLLFELLTGKLPASGRTADETLAQHLQGVPSRLTGLPSEVPSNLRAILKRSLEPDRRRRYASAGELAKDLETLTRPARQLPQRRTLLRLAGGAVLVLAAVAAFVSWQRGRQAAPPQPDDSALPAIVILPFANETGRGDLAWLSTGVPELLFESLVGHAELRVVNPLRVAQAISDLKIEPGGVSEATLDLAAGVFDGASLVTGSIRDADGGGIRVDAQLIKPSAGLSAPVFLHAEAPSGAGASNRIVDQLRTALLESLSVAARPPEAPLVSTALPQYTEAVQELRRGEVPRARSLLEDAVDKDPDFGAAWLRLSQANEAMGQDEEALAAADRAATVFSGAAGGDTRYALLARAQQARLAGESDRAQDLLRELVQAFPGDIESAIELADAYGGAGQFGEALDLLGQIVESAPSNAEAWFLRAKYSILSGQSRPAVDEYLVRAMVLQNRLRNRQGQADVMNAFGVGYRELGEMDQAEESYQRAAELRREIGDQRGYATSLRNLAQIAIFRADFDAAESNLQAARETFEELGDQAGIADLYNELGIMEETRSAYEAALTHFRAALQIRRELGDKRAIAESLNNIGFADHQLGKLDDASVYWQQALDIYSETGNVEGQTTVRHGLGQLYTTRGDWQQAQQELIAALNGARELDWEPAIAVSDAYLGRVAQYQGRYAAALSYYDQALARFAELEDARGIVEFSMAKAETLLELGAAAAALELLDGLEEPLVAVGSDDQRAERLVLRGRGLLLEDDAAAGKRALAEALETAAESANRSLLLRLRLASLRATPSIPALEKVADDARALGDKSLELAATLALAESLFAENKPQEALAELSGLDRLLRRTGDWSRTHAAHALRAAIERAQGNDPKRWLELQERELERVGEGLAPELASRLRASVGLGEVADAA